MGELICAAFTGTICIVLSIYVSYTAKEKGPILSNTYLFASKEERAKMDIKKEYHLVTVVFSLIAGYFAMLTLYILAVWKWCLYAAIIFLAGAVLYAVKESVKTLRDENGKS